MTTIRTVEELEALPDDAALQMPGGALMVSLAAKQYVRTLAVTGDDYRAFPATILAPRVVTFEHVQDIACEMYVTGADDHEAPENRRAHWHGPFMERGIRRHWERLAEVAVAALGFEVQGD